MVDPNDQCAVVAASLQRSPERRARPVPLFIFLPGPSDAGDPTDVIREYAAEHADSFEILSVPVEFARLTAGACAVDELPALLGVLRNRVVSKFTGAFTPAHLDRFTQDVLQLARD